MAMRLLTLVVAFILAVESVIGATLTGTASNGYTLYNAGSLAACVQSSGGCTIGDQYTASSQNVQLITGSPSNTYKVFFNTITQIGILNVAYNSQTQNPLTSVLYLVMNQGFTAAQVNIGMNASVITSGTQTQNAIQLIIGSLTVLGSINSNAYKMTVNFATTLTGGSLTLGTLYASGTASFSSATINAAVGFKNSAVSTFSNTNIYANQVWASQNGSTSTYSVNCTNGGVIQTTGDFTVNTPQVITGCSVQASGNLVVIPAPPTHKRDGSTLATVFSGGSCNANGLVQPGTYTSTALFRKREAEVHEPEPTNPPTPAPTTNALQINNGHKMLISQSITQNGGASTTTFVPDCASVLTCNFASSVAQIAAECPGCYFNPSCPQSYVPGCKGAKRCHA